MSHRQDDTPDETSDPMADAPTWPGADAYDHASADPQALADRVGRTADEALAAFGRALRPLYERLRQERDRLAALPGVDMATARTQLAPLTRTLAELEALLARVSVAQ
jgi:hypothetical protein